MTSPFKGKLHIRHNIAHIVFIFSKCKCQREKYGTERLQRANLLKSLQVKHINVSADSC